MDHPRLWLFRSPWALLPPTSDRLSHDYAVQPFVPFLDVLEEDYDQDVRFVLVALPWAEVVF